MSSSKEIVNLLKKVYSNTESLQTWLQNPKETTKQWELEIPEEKIETIKSTIDYISNNLEQVQEVRYVNQYTIKKISEVMRHGIFSFYTMLTIQVIAFLLSIVVFFFGIYAFFQAYHFLGLFLCCLGMPAVAYFLLEKPLQDLNQNIGNLVQTQVALGAWFNEMTYWQIHAKESDFEEKQMVAQTMRDAAKWAVMLIEDYANHKSGESRNKKYSDVVAKVRGMVNQWQKNKKETDPLLLTENTSDAKQHDKEVVAEEKPISTNNNENQKETKDSSDEQKTES